MYHEADLLFITNKLVKFLECNIREITRRGSWARGFFYHWAFMQVYLVFGCLLDKMCISHILIRHCICAIPQYDHSVCAFFCFSRFFFFVLLHFAVHIILCIKWPLWRRKIWQSFDEIVFMHFSHNIFLRKHKRQTNEMYRKLILYKIQFNARGLFSSYRNHHTIDGNCRWFHLKWPWLTIASTYKFIFQLFLVKHFQLSSNNPHFIYDFYDMSFATSKKCDIFISVGPRWNLCIFNELYADINNLITQWQVTSKFHISFMSFSLSLFFFVFLLFFWSKDKHLLEIYASGTCDWKKEI